MSFISLMEIIGTVAFAVSGAIVAIEKKLDILCVKFNWNLAKVDVPEEENGENQ